MTDNDILNIFRIYTIANRCGFDIDDNINISIYCDNLNKEEKVLNKEQYLYTLDLCCKLIEVDVFRFKQDEIFILNMLNFLVKNDYNNLEEITINQSIL